MPQVALDGSSLTLENVVQVSRQDAQVSISQSALARTAQARKTLEKLLDEKDSIYGVNTGFGALSDQRIPQEKLEALQTNLIRSHAASVGPALSRDVVRALMLLRANTLLKGNSGVRPEIPETIVDLLNRHVHPFIPAKGSVGASGDLSPLSHMSLVLVGEGGAEYEGKWVTGTKGMEMAGRKPLVLGAKEGLALNNGTQQMLAIGSLALHDAFSLLRSGEAALALSLEAMQGWTDAYDPRIQMVRPHRGQEVVAGDVRNLLHNSAMVRSVTDGRRHSGRPQDPYSFRCAPQVMGAVLDALNYVKTILEVEMNSATDNPLVFPEDSLCLSGGNFHGQPVSMAMDILALSLSTLSNISERRVAALLDPSLNNGLPPFLVGRGSQPGLSSGFMAVQYTATALVAENKTLTHPASSDSIPTSSNFEDFVSMGPGAAQKAETILRNAEYVVAIELLCAAQAVDLRDSVKLGDGTAKTYRLIRDHVKTMTEDRSSHEDIEEVRSLVKLGRVSELMASRTP